MIIMSSFDGLIWLGTCVCVSLSLSGQKNHSLDER